MQGELSDRGALSAGDDERVDRIELFGATDVDSIGPESPEGLDVLAEIALKAEDAGAS
jgi:hypothetical protein